MCLTGSQEESMAIGERSAHFGTRSCGRLLKFVSSPSIGTLDARVFLEHRIPYLLKFEASPTPPPRTKSHAFLAGESAQPHVALWP